MPLQLTPINEENRAVAERLMQLCLHDLSEYTAIEPTEQGSFTAMPAEIFGDRSFLILLRGKPAGLAAVAVKPQTSQESPHTFNLIFVVRCYRGLGLAEEAVLNVVRCFPGHWRSRVEVDNTTGLAFWRHILRRHAGKNYRELATTCGSARVFEFVSNADSVVWS